MADLVSGAELRAAYQEWVPGDRYYFEDDMAYIIEDDEGNWILDESRMFTKEEVEVLGWLVWQGPFYETPGRWNCASLWDLVMEQRSRAGARTSFNYEVVVDAQATQVEPCGECEECLAGIRCREISFGDETVESVANLLDNLSHGHVEWLLDDIVAWLEGRRVR